MVPGVVGERIQQRQQQRDGQGGVQQFGQFPQVELQHLGQPHPGLLESGHVAEQVEGDPEQREAAEADAQGQQEFAEQVAVEEAHRTGRSYAGSDRLTNPLCWLEAGPRFR